MQANRSSVADYGAQVLPNIPDASDIWILLWAASNPLGSIAAISRNGALTVPEGIVGR